MRKTHESKTTTEVFRHPETGNTVYTKVRVRTAAETARLTRLSASLATPRRGRRPYQPV